MAGPNAHQTWAEQRAAHLGPAPQWQPEMAADAVAQADPAVLIAALVQATGDLDLLERAENELRDTPPRSRAEVEEGLREVARHAVATMSGLADAAGLAVDDEATMQRLMCLCAREKVSPEYLPLVLEESNFDGGDPRRFRWSDAATPPDRSGFRVGIIGAGLAGLCLAIRLEQAGVAYTIFEKNDTVGGTWAENDYPDLRVDVPNHFYSYSFEPNPDWSDHYARRAEIADYIERCADKYGIRPNVVLATEVTSARYDITTATWAVETRSSSGAVANHEFNAVVSAVGMLNRPSTPDIAGLDDFDGPCFHSSHWDHDLDLAGRRVAVIGTGASAMQIVPAIAPEVERLLVFQRARHWVLPNPNYHRSIPVGEKWLLRNVPFYLGWYRFVMFWQNSDRLYPAFKVDPEWQDQTLSISPANEKLRRIMTDYIRSELGPDSDLVERVLPDYPPLGKRMLQDNGWYRTLVRDDVDLVCDPIDHLTAAGVVTTTGETYDVDVVVLATGFHANRFLWPIEIVGRDGAVLHDIWGDDPRAYLGITVPGFPNLFCLYGPNTNPVVGSVIFVLECQVSYVASCIRMLLEGGYSAMECRQDVHDDYNRRVDAANEQLVWRHPRVHSYYNNASGRVTTNAPWRLVDYWRMTRAVTPDDFVLTEATRARAGSS